MSSQASQRQGVGKALLSGRLGSYHNPPAIAELSVPAHSSSLSNRSSGSRSLQHLWWSDQSCSTTSSLPREDGSPQSLYHPRPQRSVNISNLLHAKSPRPESVSSVRAQNGSQCTLDMFPSLDIGRSVDGFNYGYDNSLGISLPRNSPKCRKRPEQRNAELRHMNPPYTGHDPQVPAVAPRGLDADGELVHAGTRYPYFLSANEQPYPKTLAACGSSASICHPSPSSSLTDHNLLSIALPSRLNTQDLVDILQESNQYKQHRNQGSTILNNLPAHPHLTQDIAGIETTCRNPLESSGPSIPDPMATNAAQYLSSAPKTPNTKPYLTHPSSTKRKSPSADTHHPALKPAISKPDVVYRQPQPFVGKLSSSETQHAPMYAAQLLTSRARKRTSNRPDIRALPNHDQDPIE
ncbi:Small GTPase superfamily, Ras type [Metarhizium brunneum]